MKQISADYVVFVGPNFDELQPELACFLEEEAKLKAWSYAQEQGIVAEVVYMPEDDVDTNVVVYQTDGIDEYSNDKK